MGCGYGVHVGGDRVVRGKFNVNVAYVRRRGLRKETKKKHHVCSG